MEDIYWFKRWDKAFEWKYPRFSWFVGGKTNIAYNCLDYKLGRFTSKTAYIYEGPERDIRYSVTYAELFNMVREYAAALRGAGIGKGIGSCCTFRTR